MTYNCAIHPILYLNAGSQLGGAERSLLDILTFIDKSKFRPIVACPSGGPLTDRIKDLGIDLHITRFEALRHPIAFISEFRDLYLYGEKNRVSLIHGNSTLSVKHAMLLGKMLGIPSAVHVRDLIFGNDFFYRLWLSKTGHIIAISEAVRKRLMQMNLRVDQINCIYNGIDTIKIKPDIDLAAIRKEFGLDRNEQVVGMVGRFSFEKGTETFLESAYLIRRSFQNVRFFIVGDTIFPNNQRYKDGAIKLAEKYNLLDCLQFTGEREDISTLFSLMDVVVIPSTREAFGRVAAEAGACGRACVATNVGGLPEIIVDGETGIIVPPADAKVMSAAILKLLRDEELRRTMGIKARERICKLFDIRRTVAEIENLYGTLLNDATVIARGNPL